MGKRLLGTSVSKQMCRLVLLFSVIVLSVEAATNDSCGRGHRKETTKESTIYLGKCTHEFVEDTEADRRYRAVRIEYHNDHARGLRNAELDHAQLANMDRKFSYVGSVEQFDVQDPYHSKTIPSPDSLDEVWENSQGYWLAKIPDMIEDGWTRWILYAPVERYRRSRFRQPDIWKEIRRSIMFTDMKNDQAFTLSGHGWDTFNSQGRVNCPRGDVMVDEYDEIVPPFASLTASLQGAKNRERAAAELVRKNDPVLLLQDIRNVNEAYQMVDAKLEPIEFLVRSFEEEIEGLREDISQLEEHRQEDRLDELAELQAFMKYDKEKLRSLKPLHGSLKRKANVLKVVLRTTQLAEAKARQQPSTLLDSLKHNLRAREEEVRQAEKDLQRWREAKKTYNEYKEEEALSETERLRQEIYIE